jgi:hypothetical protein
MTDRTTLPAFFTKYHRRNIHMVYEWVPGRSGNAAICVCGAVGRSGESEKEFLESDVHHDVGLGGTSRAYVIQFRGDKTQRKLRIRCQACKETLDFGGWSGTARYNPQFDRARVSQHLAKCQAESDAE